MSLIAHVDMDAFFASVEQSRDPTLKGKPVIIGADPKRGKGRGVVAAASYEARRYGVHSAMPIQRAYRLCPQGVYLKPDFSSYSRVSQQVMAVLESFSYLIEPVSIDEAYLDLTGLEQPPEKLGVSIQKAVFEQTGCTASIGMAGNKATAKIASAMKKPNGLSICPPGKERAYIALLPVKKIPGVGEKMQLILDQLGIRSIDELSNAPTWMIENRLGNYGKKIQKIAMGEDPRAVEPGSSRKSVSVERTFQQDLKSIEAIKEALQVISDTLAQRLDTKQLKGSTVTLKVRYSNFDTFTRNKTLPVPINSAHNLNRVGLELLANNLEKEKQVRLLGLGVSGLEDVEPRIQLSLFQEEIL